jgi:hypothetical protein
MAPVFRALLLGAWWLSFPVHAAGDRSLPPSGVNDWVENAPAATPAVAVAGTVTRAVFTTKVANRKPTNTISSLTNDITRICYFTEIEGMAGQTVIHRWEYNGKLMLEKSFKVGAARWRVYSMKTLDPSWLGEWKASTIDANGSSLSVNTFTYLNKAAASATSTN